MKYPNYGFTQGHHEAAHCSARARYLTPFNKPLIIAMPATRSKAYRFIPFNDRKEDVIAPVG